MERKPPKPKKCKVCPSQFTPARSFQNWCSPDCAIELVRRKEAKKAQEVKRKQKRSDRARKEELKSLEELCVELQRIVNKYTRLRDVKSGYLCISCGIRPIDDAGHFYHAGTKYRVSRLRFNLSNINGQCSHCNRFAGGGNGVAYMEGFIERYGQEKYNELVEAKLREDRGEEKPLTKYEVRDMRSQFRAMIRDIESLA